MPEKNSEEPVDILERLRLLLVYLTQHLLVGYQAIVLIITSIFLLILAILYFFFHDLLGF